MKKIIAMLLIISFALSLTSCGNKTDLNIDNLDDYFIITNTTSGCGEEYSGTISKYHEDILGGTKTVYTNLLFYTTIKGASTNFNYKDVILKLRVSGSYHYLYDSNTNSRHLDSMLYNSNPKKFSFEYDIPLNISGNGEGGTTIVDLLYPEADRVHDNDFDLIYATSVDLVNVTYEIISISGYVEPA